MGLISLNSGMSPTVDGNRGDIILTALSRVDGSALESFVLQHFPEDISDSKQVSHQQKEVPGGSLPIYQWSNSGERLISFTAIFASDVDLLAKGKSRAQETMDAIKSAGLERSNVDIRTAIAHLRKFMLPTYGEDQGLGVPVSYAPQRVRLFIPGSGIGISGGTSGSDGVVTPDSIICVMTQCDVNYQAFFPSGLPRIAEVQLAFAQVPQTGKGMVQFPQAPLEGQDVAALGGEYAAGSQVFLSYTLQPRKRGGDH